jgi:predicted metal-dependent enzyme (double-stranded beta helix superfamily)
MFETEQFIEACRIALREHSPQLAVKELVAAAVSSPAEVLRALGTPEASGIQTIHRSDELTILNVVWAPLMSIYPHDHRTWAVIGIYGGQEDNAFYRRRKNEPGLDLANERSLSEEDTISLGEDVIHAVTNPRRKYTGAIHVYGGDFFAIERSEWESPMAAEQRYSVDHAMRTFAEANERAQELLANGG